MDSSSQLPFSNSSNLAWITFLHKLYCSIASLHNHLHSKAWLKTYLLIPNPLNLLSLQTFEDASFFFSQDHLIISLFKFSLIQSSLF